MDCDKRLMILKYNPQEELRGFEYFGSPGNHFVELWNLGPFLI